MPATNRNTSNKKAKVNKGMNVTIKNADNGLTMLVPIEDVINSTYSDVACLKKDQVEMKEQLISNSKSLGEIKKSLSDIDASISKMNVNCENKVSELEEKQIKDIQEVKSLIPRKFTTWITEKAKTADAITKVLKISIVIFIIVWTIVSGIPGLFNLLKTIGIKI